MRIKFIAVFIFALTSCGGREQVADQEVDRSSPNDTAIVVNNDNVPEELKNETGWDSIDFSSPVVRYKEVASRDVQIQGGMNYSVYGIISEVLFDAGKSTLRAEAKQALTQVCTSIKQHYPGGQVRIYGYADSVGGEAANIELSENRASAVKSYLSAECGLDERQISLQAEGERYPVASNSHENGRQQNRRVRIVARR